MKSNSLRFFTIANFQPLAWLASCCLLLVTSAPAADYYWTGAGANNADGNKEWNDPNNWLVGGPTVGAGGVVPATGPSLSTTSSFDNVFLTGGTSYMGGITGQNTFYQRINNLTVTGGSSLLGGRYTTNTPDLRVDGDFLIQAGSLYLGAYSPNVARFYGGFTAASGTTLGNAGSTSDGGYWDLTNATSIVLNGVTLNQMTNNWQHNPQAWNFGADGTAIAIQLTNNNTFNLVQNVVDGPRDTVDTRGSLQLTIHNQITGTGGITKTGDATLILDQDSSNYNGATNINQGILILRGGNAIGDTSAVTLGNYQGGASGGSVKATLILEDDETIGSLAGGGAIGGNVILNGHVLTLGGNNSSTTFSGIIGGTLTGTAQTARTNQGTTPSYSPYTDVGYVYAPDPALGDGSLLKTGTGTLTLSGASLYTGTTTLQQGQIIAVGEVNSTQPGPLGQSSSAVIVGNASTVAAPDVNTANLLLTVSNNTGGVVNWEFDRDIDASGTNVTGRTRFTFASGNALDTSTLTLSGDVTFSSTSGRGYEFTSQRLGQTLNITGLISGVASTVYWNGSNTGLGTIRLGNTANSYSGTNNLINGTLIVAGSVLGSSASAVGTGAVNLADGATRAVNASDETGINAIPSLFLETPGAEYSRSIALNLGGTAGGGNQVVNGYRLGGVNTSGKVTFTGNVNSATTAAGLINLALFAADGGTTEFSGVINDNPHGTQVTRVTINQFVHHPDLLQESERNVPVGTATEGTVILSGPNTYQGGTTVRGGTLLANNSSGSATGSGSVLVTNAGTTLGGTGSISGGTSQSITLEAGTFLMVGETHGEAGLAADLALGSSTSVSMNFAGTLQFDIFGNDAGVTQGEADRLLLFTTSAVNLSGALHVVDMTGTSNLWTIGDSWRLFDWSGVSSVTGTFSSFVLPDLNDTLYAWDTSQVYTAGTISVTAVPEPGRALLALLGLAGMWMRRRR